MTTGTQFTREQWGNMTADQIEAAAKASNSSPMEALEANPQNFQQVIRKADPYGNNFTQSGDAQIIRDAGLWPIYNTESGVVSFVLKNMLYFKLRERDLAGREIWTADPALAPKIRESQYPCILHAEHAMRSVANEMGFPLCEKMLRTPNDQYNHSKKHTNSWAAFERRRIDAKETEEREWRQGSIEAQTVMAQSLSSAVMPPSDYEKACIGCGESFFASDEVASQTKLEVHHRGCSYYQEFYGEKPLTVEAELSPPYTDVSGATLQDVAGPTMFTTACNADGCLHMSKGKSLAGAKASLRSHVKKEHPDAD